ncbi:MAG: DUF4932 domain-containing protein [Flavobacterium sp.]|jgi:hypothetical protein|nr:DUF4932 domain-containing protein [Flavobacterium sp.]
MKKTSLLILLLLIIAFACKEKTANKTIISENNLENKVIFKIDERTEFFRTIFNLAVQDDLPSDIKPCNTEYLNRINTYFKPFKNHNLIKYIYDHETMGIDFPTVGLMYESLENFQMDSIYRKEFPIYGMTIEEMDSIKPLLVDFYNKSNFQTFFYKNKKYYKDATKKVQREIDKENLFSTITEFYQSDENGLELNVIVELTNNANNKAVSFYDKYNTKKRAVIVANLCENSNKPTSQNTFLELDNSLRTRIYHESSHLFTDKLLNKHIGNLEQYKSICEDCNETEITDTVDHLIVNVLQELISYREFGKDDGHNFYLNKCKDVRKEIYIKLSSYQPKGEIPFEQIYVECMNMIKQAASEK